jgi:hypothetical protein
LLRNDTYCLANIFSLTRLLLAWTVLADNASAIAARGEQFRRRCQPIRLCNDAVTPPAATAGGRVRFSAGAKAIPGDLHGQYHIHFAVPVA